MSLSSGLPPPPEHDESPSGELARRIFVVLLVVGLSVLFVWMVGRLLVGVLLGIILWSMTQWMYTRFARLFRGRRSLAAAATVVGTILLVVIPATALVYFAVMDASNLAENASKWIEPYRPQFQQRLDQLQHGGTRLFGINITLQDVVGRIEQGWSTVGTFVVAATKKLTGGLFDVLLMIFVMLYTQFFFCLDGPRFLEWFTRLLPLSRAHAGDLVDDFFATSRSTLKTLGVIGSIQGGLGGLAFWVLGIPAPIFWTVVMALCSAIPSVGAQIVIVPVGVILIAIGKTWAGIGLLAWGLVVIASIDNLVRPVIVKRDINLHELLVLVSTLGGITAFGFFGVIIGPVIAAMLKASLRIYAETHGTSEGLVIESSSGSSDETRAA